MNSLLDIVTIFYQSIWSEQDFNAVDQIIDENYHPPDVAMQEKGPALIKMEVGYFSSIFKDLKYTIEDYVTKNHQEIWVYYKITGIFSNSGWGFEPNQKQIEGRGVGMFTIINGKITDQRRVYCLYELFASSGAIPPFWALSDRLHV